MNSPLFTLHVVALSFWIGVVGAEFVIERSRADSKQHGFSVANNHFWIDALLEIPAVLVVLATGALMLLHTELTPLLAVKAGLGAFACVSNLVCIVPVTLRRRAANRGDLADVRRHSKTIDVISLLGIPAATAALLIGLYRVI